MILNRIELSFLITEIARAVKDLNTLISKIQFSKPEENKTLDEIMNEVTVLQGNLIGDGDSGEDVQIVLPTDNLSVDNMNEETWKTFVNDAKIIIQNAPVVSTSNIQAIPITLGSELYIKYVAYYYKVIESIFECEKVLVSKFNTANDLKFVYYAFKQIAINTNVVNFVYGNIKDFEVNVSDVFDEDMQHWNSEYRNLTHTGIYTHSGEQVYSLLTESLQLLHKYCALTTKLSESGFEQFTGSAHMLNDVSAATNSVMKYYEFVKINK